MIGKTISHYKILEKLGGGGMGVVYKAQDLKLDRFVALKFLPPELGRDEQEKKRFVLEAKAASAIEHKNICIVYEIGETEDGQLFIAMAYYDGETLKQKISRSPLPIKQALEIGIKICSGLARAHEEKVVHRDIKPANVMLTVRDEVRVMDFGLAKLAGSVQLTTTGSTVGTVAYMSPEQARGQKVDHRTDVWSFGALLYEMITGQEPFKGEKAPAVLRAILEEEPEPVTGLRSGVPMELERVINKCLTKEPGKRYQHMDEIAVDLQSVLDEVGSGSRPVHHAQRRSRRGVFLGAISVVVLAVVAVLIFFFSQQSSPVSKKSIAVLPFENLNDAADDYFSDGITEDILTRLSKISDLLVISSKATKRYKDSPKGPREIGKELGVAVLLSGSVRRESERLRINCQLIDAEAETQLWAETYDRALQDIFAIQSEVAQQVAKALEVQLLPSDRNRIEKPSTTNQAAYEYYLKGRQDYRRYTQADNDRAIELFKKALALDPAYVLALAGLGDAYAQRGGTYNYSVSWVDSAIVVGQRAVRLDPLSAYAHKALGLAYYFKSRYDDALSSYSEAVRLNPNHDSAVSNIAYIYKDRGQLDEALRWAKQGAYLNPVVGNSYSYVAYLYRGLNLDSQAELWFQKALEIQPDSRFTYLRLAFYYLSQGNNHLVLEQVDKAISIASDNAETYDWAGIITHFLGELSLAEEYWRKALTLYQSFETDPHSCVRMGLGHINLVEGKHVEAKDWLRKAMSVRLEWKEQDSVILQEIAAIHAIQDNKEEAYKWLRKAIDAGWWDYRLAQIDPWFENLHGEPEFEALMADVKAKVDSMRARVEEMGW